MHFVHNILNECWLSYLLTLASSNSPCPFKIRIIPFTFLLSWSPITLRWGLMWCQCIVARLIIWLLLMMALHWQSLCALNVCSNHKSYFPHSTWAQKLVTCCFIHRRIWKFMSTTLEQADWVWVIQHFASSIIYIICGCMWMCTWAEGGEHRVCFQYKFC